ncbi:glycosyltransferase family 4 protein [Photobacterium sp. OFAV2-7]|uniref:glycosyltransferase family 4 protein n=1 Tax=Photobacterium sp. OFAV2-7 TaxID=2917748 RepID=UPI001EF5C086|nr:glycosyltransferase family 4 protein [Photobacterium sp. OFAV2-7]MCG7585847.1 glycosyltransferase family 4 protein [Photobacterium sp. OFAV2-7]
MKTVYLVCDIELSQGSSFYDYLRALKSPDCRYVLVTPAISEEARVALEQDGYRCHCTSRWWLFAKLLWLYPADIVHFHFYGLGHPLLLVARAYCSKVVVSIHHSLSNDTEMSARTRFKRWLYSKLVSRLIAVSPFVEGWLRQDVHPDKVHLITNGVDTVRFHYQAPAPFNGILQCLFVGNLIDHKGLTLLLALFEKPEIAAIARLTIIGDGELRPEIEQKAETNPAVIYLGPSSQVEKAMKTAHVILMPSQWHEAFGYVAAEAMASGRAVIAQPKGGLAQLFQHDCQGWYLDFNNPQRVKELLQRLYLCPNDYFDAGRAARNWAESYFCLSRQIHQTHLLYQSLLGPSTAGAVLSSYHGRR